jgi:hypothetical protein
MPCAARIHARFSAELAAKGTAVGSHDLIIAATALAKGYIITTRDETQLSENPGVVVSTLVTGEADRVPLDSKIKDLTLTFCSSPRSPTVDTETRAECPPAA